MLAAALPAAALILASPAPAEAGGNAGGIIGALIGAAFIGAATAAAHPQYEQPAPVYYPPPQQPYYYQPSPAYAPSYPPMALPAPSSYYGWGAQFTQQGWRNGRLVVRIDGDIAPGDDARALAFANTIPVGTPVQVILNSRGGAVVPAAGIALLIRRTGSTTRVEGECSSSCFLLYAAGVERSYAPGAHIGVHSASQNGSDTYGARELTTRMARACAELGVPAEIIGRMVATPPNGIAWLTPAELAAMGAWQSLG
jgi:hypothetical protein